jgi:integrase
MAETAGFCPGHLLLRLLYETGCTVNELVNIRTKDVSAEQCIIRIRAENSRNHEYREAHVSQRLIHLISRPEGGELGEFVLSTRQSASMTTKRARQIVQSSCRSVGIEDANPQILRYTHIAHAFMKNVPVDAIQKQVGLKRSRAIEVFGQLSALSPKDVYRRFLE